jgi:hypothetical protein
MLRLARPATQGRRSRKALHQEASPNPLKRAAVMWAHLDCKVRGHSHRRRLVSCRPTMSSRLACLMSTLIKTDPPALKNNGSSKCAGRSTVWSRVGRVQPLSRVASPAPTGRNHEHARRGAPQRPSILLLWFDPAGGLLPFSNRDAKGKHKVIGQS